MSGIVSAKRRAAARKHADRRPWWYWQVLDFCRRANDLHHRRRARKAAK